MNIKFLVITTDYPHLDKAGVQSDFVRRLAEVHKVGGDEAVEMRWKVMALDTAQASHCQVCFPDDEAVVFYDGVTDEAAIKIFRQQTEEAV